MERDAVDEAQGLAAFGVEAGADDNRRAGEAFGFEMAEESVDGFGPGAGLSVDDVADAGNGSAAAAGEGDFGGDGHA
jgi:hypothetical protein